jgi:hypothetical protein
LSHLKPPAQEAATLCDAERIHRVRRERWIGYPKANYAVKRLDALFNWPSRQRMPNLLIVGPTNNGKSMVVERFRRLNEPKPVAEETEKERIPILAVQMPSDPSIARFYVMLMASMGAPLRLAGRRTPDYEHRTLTLLRAVGVRILIIDELHNILAGSTKDQREFLNLLRFLGNELRIPIVGVGTKEAYLAIRSDDQLENRFEPLPLPTWQIGDDLRSLLASFAASFPLRRRSVLSSVEMAKYVLDRSEGTIGEIAQLLSAAAIVAIQSGEEAITSRTLRMADYRSPNERRRTFEREIA